VRVGEIRRLSYDEFDPDLREVLRAKVERLGYLGEFFAVAGHQAAATVAFQTFTEALKQALPPELTQVVALTVASTLDNDYELSQHERLARNLGFSDAWIEAATGRTDFVSLSEAARCAHELALAMMSTDGHGASEELGLAVDVLGEEFAVGVLLTVGRYVAHSVMSNTLGLRAPVGGMSGGTILDDDSVATP
jgi:alkylhydroperoxidase family enzyme